MEVITIKIGFIGAGKVGFSLGKYLKENNKNVVGYYSQSEHSSKEASTFTNTKQYKDLSKLVEKCDIILITTPDSQIKSVWENLKSFPINNKIICHCSGAISSLVFSNIKNYGAHGYSIHPILAISDKYNSYKNLSKAFITIEGDEKYISYIKSLFESFGNNVGIISKFDKVLYHQSCVSVSNLMIPLVHNSIQNLNLCGFTDEDAIKALYPLIELNLKNIKDQGTIKSLTGPIERGDLKTIKDHCDALDEDERILYKVLSMNLLKLAKQKNEFRDYEKIQKYLEE